MLPYHIERARKKWQRQTRVGTAIVLLGLSACSAGATSSFFSWDDEDSAQSLRVAVQPLEGVPQANADALADELRLAMAKHKSKGTEISAVLGASRKPNGLYVVTIIDLKDKSGARLDRVMDEKLVQAEAGPDGAMSIPEDELKRVAADAAARLGTVSTQLATADADSDDTLTTASLASNAAFKIDMGPTPGDGGLALTDALHKALNKGLKSKHVSGRYRIEGKLSTASALNGNAAISIEWLVSTEDGRKLGAVTQKNNVPPASIATHWDDVATSAGEAAAEGVLALLDAG